MKSAIAILALSAAAVCAPFCRASAAEPHCNVMQFFDAKGAIMATPSPVVGLMIGDRPVYEQEVSGAASIKPGAETACPQTLIDGVRETFQASCMSEQRRKQAAAEHKVDGTVIDKGCSDMVKALGPAMIPPK